MENPNRMSLEKKIPPRAPAPAFRAGNIYERRYHQQRRPADRWQPGRQHQLLSKVVIGANGVVEGDIHGRQADIRGKVTGTIKVKDLLQLKGGSMVRNYRLPKLQIEPTANFNGECHMAPQPAATAAGKAAPEIRKDVKTCRTRRRLIRGSGRAG